MRKGIVIVIALILAAFMLVKARAPNYEESYIRVAIGNGLTEDEAKCALGHDLKDALLYGPLSESDADYRDVKRMARRSVELLEACKDVRAK